MRYLKMIGLAAVAATALAAFVGGGTASASGIVCSTATTPCASPWAVGTVFDFSMKSGSSLRMVTTEGTTIDTCAGSTVKGKLTQNSGGVATGENTEIAWTGCTWTTDTIKLGKLRITNVTATYNGTLIADEEIRVTINSGVTGDCEFGVQAGTTLGTVKEGIGTAATFTMNAIVSRLNFCLAPATERWTAEYVLTSPTNTTLAVSPS